jgi:hypothetical protein
VIADHKSKFGSDRETLARHALDNEQQLKQYSAAVKAATSVTEVICLIHYPLAGCAVEVVEQFLAGSIQPWQRVIVDSLHTEAG